MKRWEPKRMSPPTSGRVLYNVLQSWLWISHAVLRSDEDERTLSTLLDLNKRSGKGLCWTPQHKIQWKSAQREKQKCHRGHLCCVSVEFYFPLNNIMYTCVCCCGAISCYQSFQSFFPIHLWRLCLLQDLRGMVTAPPLLQSKLKSRMLDVSKNHWGKTGHLNTKHFYKAWFLPAHCSMFFPIWF